MEMNYGNRNAEIQQAELMLKERLKEEIAKKEAVTKRVDDLEEIVVMAISACVDHSPMLGEMLMAKAERVFGKKLK